jgi:hypothetical protein
MRRLRRIASPNVRFSHSPNRRRAELPVTRHEFFGREAKITRVKGTLDHYAYVGSKRLGPKRFKSAHAALKAIHSHVGIH